MLFFDQNDWFTQRARKKDLETTKANIEFLKGEITKMEGELKALNTDTGELERYAREKYHEKRAGEDLYLIHIDTVKPAEKPWIPKLIFRT